MTTFTPRSDAIGGVTELRYETLGRGNVLTEMHEPGDHLATRLATYWLHMPTAGYRQRLQRDFGRFMNCPCRGFQRSHNRQIIHRISNARLDNSSEPEAAN